MMMLHLYVLQNQWILMSLLAGVGLVLAMCLTYQAMWLPRRIEEKTDEVRVKSVKSFFTWLTGFMPWILVLVIVATTAFTILKVIENAQIPPNW